MKEKNGDIWLIHDSVFFLKKKIFFPVEVLEEHGKMRRCTETKSQKTVF
jgi:hypothetical protein